MCVYVCMSASQPRNVIFIARRVIFERDFVLVVACDTYAHLLLNNFYEIHSPRATTTRTHFAKGIDDGDDKKMHLTESH